MFTIYLAHNLLFFLFSDQFNVYTIWITIIIVSTLLGVLLNITYKKIGKMASLKAVIGIISFKLAKRIAIKSQYKFEETEEIKKIWENLNKYFCFNETPISTIKTYYGNVSIYKHANDEEIFYRKGIRCNEENNDKTYFRYNFDEISINESRVYKHSFEPYERIAEFLLLTEDEKIINGNGKGLHYCSYTFFDNMCYCFVSTRDSHWY